MGKRPAGARHIRTSAPASPAHSPGLSRLGAAADPVAEAMLDGLLTAPVNADPPVNAYPPVNADPLILRAVPPASDDAAVSDTDQAALDLDAILSMAFGVEPVAVPEPAADARTAAAPAAVADDLLEDIFGDWDLGSGSDDPGDDFFPADADDFDAAFGAASVARVAPAKGAAPPAPAGQNRRQIPPDAEFDLPDDAADARDARDESVEDGALPNLDLDDLFALDTAPPPPRARTRADTTPAPHPDHTHRRAAVPQLDRVLQIGAARPGHWSKWWPRLLWAAVLAGLVYVAFLPYPYEVGGDFVVQPLQRSEARSRTDGEIIQVNVDEGTWVKEGDILAILSNVNQSKDVAVNQSDDAKLRADLATMENGAKPEEIAVAREAVVSADRVVAVTQKDLDRQQALFDSGTIAEKLLETARNTRDAAISARDEAAAKLALVSSPAKPTEIDAQKAAIARNQQELDFARVMLEYANVRAPQEGQIVSSLSAVPVGAYLPQGGLFAELENNRTVIAEVDIPETYIKEVGIGAKAELRLWSNPETSIFGTVSSIAPRAEQRDFGWVIRVEVEVPNPEGRLAANMTGFGKVAAAERPVWQAFTEAIVGFFKIELWSWVP